MYMYGKGILSNNTTKTTVIRLWVGGYTTKESHNMFTISLKNLILKGLPFGYYFRLTKIL